MKYFGLFCIANFGLRVSECCLLKFYHFEQCETGYILVPTIKKRQKIRCQYCKKFIKKNKCTTPECKGINDIQLKNKPIDMKIICSSNLCSTIFEHIIQIKSIYKNNRDNWVFPSKRKGGQQLSRKYFENAFNDAILKLGLNRKYSIHSLRHYRGSKLYKETRDLILVQHEMRHSNSNTTQIYVHLVEYEENMQKLRKMNGLI